MLLQPGYQIKVRSASGKLRMCDVEAVHLHFVVLRQQHSVKTHILKDDDEILGTWDASGEVVA